MTDDIRSFTAARWRAAAEAGNADAAAACFAPGAELVSPLTERFRFRGRDQIAELLGAAFSVVEGIRFHTEVRDGDTVALVARARIGAQELEEAQLLRLDDAGLIRELTIFGRPLPALTALMAALGPAMARRQGRGGLAGFLAASTAPLNAMARFGEHRVVPLADPARGAQR